MRRDIVILAHGWLAGPWQLAPLERALAEAGFDVCSVAYKSLFGRFDNAVGTVSRTVRTQSGGKVHLVGFSLGGLVMRAAAAEGLPNVVSLLLIGVPNAGSGFADLLHWVFPAPALRELRRAAPRPPDPPPGIRVGCIAGDRAGLAGVFLPKPNDSRVTLASALAIRHQDERVVGCKHRDLPGHPEVLRQAIQFIREAAQIGITSTVRSR